MGPGSGPACDIRLNTRLSEDQRRRFQNVDTIRRLLRESHVIAIVGLSSDAAKASHFVGTYLQHEGYRIVPVNPNAKEILGERAWPDLASIPFPVDLVEVFRPGRESVAIAQQAIATGAPALWFQIGRASYRERV